MASTTNSTGGSSTGTDNNNPGQESTSKNSESTAYEYSCSSSSRTPAAESSSSLSVSSTSNDFHNEMSTSGCSSNINKQQKYKNMKKAKVRDCMNEIKALMSDLGKSKGKAPGGTLTTLQQVLQSIRKIHQDDEETIIPKETIQIAKTPNEKEPLEAFGITLSCNNLVVMDVSEELTNLLGFPKDSWKGRPITNFIMRKDIPTLNTSLYSLANGVETNGPPPKNFFARFRCFESLSQGFNMNKVVEYIPLEAKIVFKKAKSKITPNLITEETYGPEKCFFLKLQPCVSAYTQDNSSAVKCFDTRHSFDCKFTHFSKSTVHLLGYLPQDLLGSSIFDVHHPDDLEELLSIYKQVIALKGQPFKSRKMRLKTGNDDWITVETEWSCFVNPWSNQVELIMGKHQVVSGPVDPDIFKSKAPTLSPATVTEMEVSALQRKIIKLLKQPPIAGASSSSLSEDCTGTNLTSDDNHLCESNTSFALPNIISDSKKGESSSDIISPAESLPTDSDTHVSYGQLNYSYNIKRFLQSRPLTLSKLEANEQSSFDNKGVDEFMISIPSHQTAHTDDSSIKVNMSEQEVCVGSPHCVVDEDSQHSAELLPPVTQVFTPVHLTQATLREHTKLQEQLYVQRVKKDQSIILPRPNQNSIILKVASCRKRAISQVDTDNEMMSKNRSRKVHQSDIDVVLKKALQNSNFLFQDNLPINSANPEKSPKRKDTDIANTPIVSNPSMFPQGIPIKPFDNSTADLYSGYQVNQAVNSVNSSQNNSQQWPCYSSPGCSFSPYVMGGLLHSGGELGPASDQHGKILSMPWPAHLQPFHVKLMEQSSNESAENTISSTEDTSSSIYYLLDSGSLPNSNTQKNLRKKNQRTSTHTRSLLNRGQRPPWVEAVHWTQDIQMRYDMPTPKLQDVLKKDREFLKSVTSSDVVTAQMYELLGEISEGGSTDTGEGDTDNKETVMEDMLRLGHQLQVHMESRVQEELMAATQPDLLIQSDNPEQDDITNCDNTEDIVNCDSMNVESMNSDSVNGSINNEDSLENNESLNAFSPEASKTDSFSKREMSVSSEGSCDDKITSDITPSDQTSSGDSASSLKESDGSNEKCVRRPKKTKEVRAPFFEKLFKPLNIEFLGNPIIPGREPFWLHNVSLTEDLSYRYQMTPPKLCNQLEEDKEFLNSNPQSDLVLGGLNSEQSRNNDSTSGDDSLEIDNHT